VQLHEEKRLSKKGYRNGFASSVPTAALLCREESDADGSKTVLLGPLADLEQLPLLGRRILGNLQSAITPLSQLGGFQVVSRSLVCICGQDSLVTDCEPPLSEATASFGFTETDETGETELWFRRCRQYQAVHRRFPTLNFR
jgi:hypothetical protein